MEWKRKRTDSRKVETENCTIDYVPVLESAGVETETGILKNVTLIQAGWTKDDARFYPREVLEAAIPAYDNVQMFSGHGQKDERTGKKERDLGAWIGNTIPGTVRFDVATESVVSDVRLIQGNPEAEMVSRMLADPLVKARLGLSHKSYVVQRNGEKNGKKGLIVEAINRVESVDWVTSANSGGNVHNATLESEVAGEMDITTLAEMRAAFPDLVMEHAKQVSTPLAEELAAAKNRIVELEAKIGNYEATQKARGYLAESKLSPAAQEVVIEAVLAGNYASDADMKAACDAKVKVFEGMVAEVKPKPSFPLSTTPDNSNSDQFANLAKKVSGGMFGIH